MKDWEKEMAREADAIEWSHRIGWQQGVTDTQAAFRELRGRFEGLQLAVPTFAAEFDALLEFKAEDTNND